MEEESREELAGGTEGRVRDRGKEDEGGVERESGWEDR